MRREVVTVDHVLPVSGFRNGDTVTREQVEALQSSGFGSNIVVVQKSPPYFMIGTFILVGLGMVLSALNYWFTMSQKAAERESERAHELAMESNELAMKSIDSMARIAGLKVENNAFYDLVTSGVGYGLLTIMIILVVVLTFKKMIH